VSDLAPATHATVVVIGEGGVAITGPSGSGKSDLALRLIDRGAKLLCDDYVHFKSENGCLMAFPAPNIEGKIEVRGIGIIPMDYLPFAKVRFCVILGDEDVRMPAQQPMTPLSGFDVPALRLNGFSASAEIRVELALQRVVDAGLWPAPLSFSEGKEQAMHR
jgi:HPr kinase/phosphorylase